MALSLYSCTNKELFETQNFKIHYEALSFIETGIFAEFSSLISLICISSVVSIYPLLLLPVFVILIFVHQFLTVQRNTRPFPITKSG